MTKLEQELKRITDRQIALTSLVELEKMSTVSSEDMQRFLLAITEYKKTHKQSLKKPAGAAKNKSAKGNKQKNRDPHSSEETPKGKKQRNKKNRKNNKQNNKQNNSVVHNDKKMLRQVAGLKKKVTELIDKTPSAAASTVDVLA